MLMPCQQYSRHTGRPPNILDQDILAWLCESINLTLFQAVVLQNRTFGLYYEPVYLLGDGCGTMQYISDEESREQSPELAEPIAVKQAEMTDGERETVDVWRFIRDLLQVVLPAIILAIIVHLFLAQATVVYGQSMEPNLQPHQRLIVDKLTYRFRAPTRNDIIVLDLPGVDDMLVKRIVGLPGETIEIRDGVVLVDGLELAEPFPHDIGHTYMAPITLGALEYFVMGDNRDNSNDSRSFGPVKRDAIVGRVWLRYWPLNQMSLF